MRIDCLGSALLRIALFALLIGFTVMQARGLTDPLVLVCVIGGVPAALGWWQQQKRAAEPLISVALLRRRPIRATLLIVIYAYFGRANVYSAAAGLLLLAAPADQRGVASGMSHAVQGVGGAVVSQIAFVFLAASTPSVESR